MTERRIELNGPCNFRDLGGYSTADGHITRWGRLYRSDSMHTLTDDDVPVLRALGVRTAVDFRSSGEIERMGIGPLHDASIHYVHSPTFDGTRDSTSITLPPDGWSASDLYARMLDTGAAAYVAAAEAIAPADALPAVFFCMAGKDRTGVFAALVLGLLGVGDDVIVEDYALTHERIDVLTQRRIERDGEEHEAAMWTGLPADLKGAHAPTMTRLLQHVDDRWGGWEGYAAFAGITPATIDTLRTQLLDT